MSGEIMNNNSAVIFRNVTKSFNGTDAVKDISFEVESGKLVTLLGPSGCGKTTTLRMIAGLELPSKGQILIGDEDVSRVSAAGRSVGMVFQSYALFPHMTVIENVRFGLSSKRKHKEESFTKAQEALRTVGLSHLEDRYPSELSGGQQQRVAIARSIVTKPKVLLFDEPLSNLDAKLRRQVRQDIRDLQRELGVTSVYVTHDQEEALAISDEIIVMKDGCISQVGSPHSLYQKPENQFVSQFIGEANKLSGILLDGPASEHQFVISNTVLFNYSSNKEAGKHDAFIRPNAIIRSNRNPTTGKEFTVEVLSSTYLGSHVEYRLDSPWGSELFMIDYSFDDPQAVGSQMQVSIDPRGVSIV